MKVVIFFFASLISLTSFSIFSSEVEKLGELTFPIFDKNPKVKKKFIRAMKLLHSFEYDNARLVFQEIQKIDPNVVLSYWGEAMTHFKLLWHIENTKLAEQAMTKLAKTPAQQMARARNDNERIYLQWIHILLEGGPFLSRYLKARSILKAAYDKNHSDQNIASFYGLSILAANKVRNIKHYMQAARVLEKVFAKNPAHPGAIHYLLHCYDDNNHVHLGLKAAHQYPIVAPSASHGNHMPSHIFLPLGHWKGVIHANTIAKRNAAAQLAKHHAKVDNYIAFQGEFTHYYHAMLWLHYGYLQARDKQKANSLLAKILQDQKKSNYKWIKWYALRMQSQQAVGDHDPINPLYLLKIDIAQQSPLDKAIYHFSRGVVSVKIKAKKRYKKALIELAKIKTSAAKVLTLQLNALASIEAKQYEQALLKLEAAIAINLPELEPYGPPALPLPRYELYANTLLKAGYCNKAWEAYRKSLAQYPGRLRSMVGLASTLELLNEEHELDYTLKLLNRHVVYRIDSKNFLQQNKKKFPNKCKNDDRTPILFSKINPPKQPIVVGMNSATNKWPSHFRSTSDKTNLSKKEKLGLKALNIMAGGQYSRQQLKNIKAKVTGQRLRIIDLRQEPHASVNGQPITLYTKNMTDTVRSATFMRRLEQIFLKKIRSENPLHYSMVDWIAQSYKIRKTIQLTAPRVLSSADLAVEFGVKYHRFYVSIIPNSTQVSEFIRLLQERDFDETWYIHCWDGGGRTTAFMIVADIWKNSHLQLPFEVFAKRHAALGGFNVMKEPKKGSISHTRYKLRLAFLKDFYYNHSLFGPDNINNRLHTRKSPLSDIDH